MARITTTQWVSEKFLGTINQLTSILTGETTYKLLESGNGYYTYGGGTRCPTPSGTIITCRSDYRTTKTYSKIQIPGPLATSKGLLTRYVVPGSEGCCYQALRSTGVMLRENDPSAAAQPWCVSP